MGAAPSKPEKYTPRYHTVSPGIVSEKNADKLADQVAKYLRVNDTQLSGEPNPISADSLQAWQEKLFSDPKNR